MKKTLWMLGVAVAALTSCTQNEVLEVPESKLIAFDTHVDKSTRAVNNLLGNDNISKFYVYGVKGSKAGDVFTNEDSPNFLFSEIEVSRTRTNEVWGAFSYEELKAWEMGKYYRFAGYSNGNEKVGSNGSVTFFGNDSKTIKTGNTTSVTKANVWGLDFTGYSSNGDDLLAAVPAERDTETNNGAQTAVHFTFKHLLSQVIFRFTYGTTQGATDIKVRIKNFKLNAIKKSNCTVICDNGETLVNWDSQYEKIADLSVNSYTGSSEGGEYDYFEGNKSMSNTAGDNIAIDQHYVIPQKNELTVSFVTESFKEEDGGEVVTNTTYYNDIPLTIANHEYWKPGFVYRYEANLNPTEHIIYFTASVSAFDDTPERDQTIRSN